MRKTALAYQWSKERGFYWGEEITCEVTGEWGNGIKCWTEVGKPLGNQYSLMRRNRKFFFILEAI